MKNVKSPAKVETGLLVILSAPSGCGKTSVVAELLKHNGSLVRCLTYTTRSPRPGEREGVDYHFISPEDFKRKKESGFFLEWASVYDNFYGTAEEDVRHLLESGKNVILSVDVQGARTIRSKMDAALIFLTPPSMEELKKRLSGRGTESSEILKRRLQEAEKEIQQVSLFDYTVQNDTIENSVRNITNLIAIEREKRRKKS
jgi:guanylate kinase